MHPAKFLALLFWFCCLLPAWVLADGGKSRFFQPSPGFQAAQDLGRDYKGKVDSIVIVVKDAMDGSKTYTEADQMSYDILNTLHIETRENVIRRRLLFHPGDSLNADLLRETEKNLRSEEFLADAYVEVSKSQDSITVVKVTTFDQWTTTLAPSVSRSGGEWIWWLGAVESNLLGQGQRLGFFVGHDLQRDTRWLEYSNTYFTPLRLALAANYAWTSDGYSYATSVTRPLRSRSDAWGYTVSLSGSVLREDLYLSGSSLQSLKDEGIQLDATDKVIGHSYKVGYWSGLGDHSGYVGVTRSFGYRLKISTTPFYNRHDRYLEGDFHPVKTDLGQLISLNGIPSPYLRHDEQIGFKTSIYQYDYKTVRNFRNLKWNENIEAGWRLEVSAAKNQEWLGANQDDWYLSQMAVYNDTWANKVFLNTSASTGYFVNKNSDIVDGTLSGNLEGQWKPLWWTSYLVSGSYAHYFASAESRNFSLGENNGLNGYPNFYYVGKARLLFAAEERFFPPWEALTFVPAFAFFFNAGNTFATYETVDLRDLHYSVGLGLRVGASKSVQKVVNHLNISWPISEKHLSSVYPVFSIKATKGL